MGKVVWLNPSSGISGDMCIGALIDLGADPEKLRAALATLVIDEKYSLDFQRVMRAGIRSLYANVKVAEAFTHRSLFDINKVIDGSGLVEYQKAQAKAVFAKLAQVEAGIHGVSVEDIQLHELGSLDAIIDICSFIVCKDLLQIERFYYSRPALGSGVVQSQHGELSVPAPAVVELLQGVEVHGGDVNVELTTPTGAAILSYFGQFVPAMPAMTIEAVGYGAGSKDFSGKANVLQMVMGSANEDKLDFDLSIPGKVEDIIELETNLDDVSGEVLGFLISSLLSLGVLDAFIIPVASKKMRSSHLLRVLVYPSDVSEISRDIFSLTGTLGIRSQAKKRYVLERYFFEIELLGEKVSVKVGPFRAKAEFDDLVRVAEISGVPLISLERLAQVEIEKHFRNH